MSIVFGATSRASAIYLMVAARDQAQHDDLARGGLATCRGRDGMKRCPAADNTGYAASPSNLPATASRRNIDAAASAGSPGRCFRDQSSIDKPPRRPAPFPQPTRLNRRSREAQPGTCRRRGWREVQAKTTWAGLTCGSPEGVLPSFTIIAIVLVQRWQQRMTGYRSAR